MNRQLMGLLGALLFAASLPAADEPQKANVDAKLLAIHLDEAKRWDMFVDSARTKKAELVPEPIYRWTNASRANGQSGAMFVWTFAGRPVAVGGVFSNPDGGRRVIMHEFHAIGSLQLFPLLKDSDHEWIPTAAVPLVPLEGAQAPEATAKGRARQIRELARDFTAHSVDDLDGRWQLRLLSRPLYRYEMAGSDLIEGAIFAFVSDAGTDPEIILFLEAVNDSGKPTWRYRAVRLSISSLYVQYKGKEVWRSLREGPTGPLSNPDHTYELNRDHSIDELPAIAVQREKGQ
jgi:hypothetical protein